MRTATCRPAERISHFAREHWNFIVRTALLMYLAWWCARELAHGTEWAILWAIEHSR